MARYGEEKDQEQAIVNKMTNWQRTQYSKALHQKREKNSGYDMPLEEINTFAKLVHPKREKTQRIMEQ